MQVNNMLIVLVLIALLPVALILIATYGFAGAGVMDFNSDSMTALDGK